MLTASFAATTNRFDDYRFIGAASPGNVRSGQSDSNDCSKTGLLKVLLTAKDRRIQSLVYIISTIKRLQGLLPEPALMHVVVYFIY